MAASVILDNLPKDATRALETAGEIELAKGMFPDPLMSSSGSEYLIGLPTYPPTKPTNFTTAPLTRHEY
jgi:hypothetical protein